MSISTLAKVASAVALLTSVSKILGFVREASLAAVFGATADTDALLIAQTIPYLLFETISYALTTTFIPVYSHIKVENGEKAAFRFANSTMWIVSLVGLALVLVGELLADALVRVVAPGLDTHTAQLTEYLSRIIFPMMIFQLISGIQTGILQANGEFVLPALAGLAQNVCIIASTLIFGPRHGIAAVAVGTLVGSALSTGLKIPALRRVGFVWNFPFSIDDAGVRRMGILVVPAVLGAGANQLNTLVDRVLASGLPEGRIAALNYATKLMQLAPSILGMAVITVTYPTLANAAARKDWESFRKGVAGSLSLINFLLMPIAVGVMVLREPLVQVVFERGAFDSGATEQTARALLFLSLGIAVFSMRDFVSRAFFSLQDTRTPMVLGFVTVGINVVLNLVLVGPLEHGGLALATTLASVVGFVLGLLMLMRKLPSGLETRAFLRSALRCGIAACLMGAVVAFFYARLNLEGESHGTMIDLGLITLLAGIGGGVYSLVVHILRVPEYTIVKRWAARAVANVAKGVIVKSPRKWFHS